MNDACLVECSDADLVHAKMRTLCTVSGRFLAVHFSAPWVLMTNFQLSFCSALIKVSLIQNEHKLKVRGHIYVRWSGFRTVKVFLS